MHFYFSVSSCSNHSSLGFSYMERAYYGRDGLSFAGTHARDRFQYYRELSSDLSACVSSSYCFDRDFIQEDEMGERHCAFQHCCFISCSGSIFCWIYVESAGFRWLPSDSLAMLEGIARNRNCLQKGRELDYGKAANILLEEFRNGKIGRITLEQAEGQEADS